MLFHLEFLALCVFEGSKEAENPPFPSDYISEDFCGFSRELVLPDATKALVVNTELPFIFTFKIIIKMTEFKVLGIIVMQIGKS